LFWSFFKSQSEKNQKVVIELKNDLKIIGTLASVDENLNFHLTNMKLADEEKNPYLVNNRSLIFQSYPARMGSLEVTQ
jgi:small nuclear ribonucleoprotein (snRNP)-like protein